MSKKYVIQFENFGESIVNVEKIIKNWDCRFLILTWINLEKKIEYTLIIKSKKGKVKLKTRIPDYQAQQLINQLNLKYIQSPLFNSGGLYR